MGRWPLGMTIAVIAALGLSACIATTAADQGRVSAADPQGSMTADDTRIAALSMQIALERRSENEPSTWTNDVSGNHGRIVPRSSYLSDGGSVCRRFDETMTVAGRTHTAHRVACRDGDGRWTTT